MSKKNTNTITLAMLEATKHGIGFVLEMRMLGFAYGPKEFNKRFGTNFKSWKEIDDAFPITSDLFDRKTQEVRARKSSSTPQN